MPDLRTVLTETLAKHLLTPFGRCLCGAGDGAWDIDDEAPWVEHQANVLLGLPGVAVTQLPEQMTDRSNVAEKIRDQPMWESDGSWAVIQDGDVEFETDSQNVCGIIPASAVPGLVAVLLAASGGTR